MTGRDLVRLSRQRWPLPGERTGGDGETWAPYLDRVMTSGRELLDRTFDPPRAADGTVKVDGVWSTYHAVLLETASFAWGPDTATVAELVRHYGGERSPSVVIDAIGFWVRHGYIEVEPAVDSVD